jgi:hypothetical protein
MSHLTDLFHQRREASGIALGDLARSCGYSNVSKGSNRIQKFERTGEIEPILLGKLASALGITPIEIHRAVAQDRAEWEAWSSEPIEPHLIVRLVAVFYSRSAIPVELRGDRVAMEEYSADYAALNRVRVCLVLSRRLRVWFDRDGRCSGVTEDSFEQSYAPLMKINGRSTLLDR